MYTDPRSKGIQAYRAARNEARIKATLANEIRANNPRLSQKQIDAIVKANLRVKEIHTQGHKKTHRSRRTQKHTDPNINTGLKDQLQALCKG